MTHRSTNKPSHSSLPAADRMPPRVHSVPVTDEDALAPEETLAEAEDEIGQNVWIDPATGELAEGEAPPHLDGD